MFPRQRKKKLQLKTEATSLPKPRTHAVSGKHLMMVLSGNVQNCSSKY